MEKVILNSSALKSAEYTTDGAMIIEFHRGVSYSYNVPVSVFRALTTADSAGRYFSTYVRRQYTGTKL